MHFPGRWKGSLNCNVTFDNKGTICVFNDRNEKRVRTHTMRRNERSSPSIFSYIVPALFVHRSHCSSCAHCRSRSFVARFSFRNRKKVNKPVNLIHVSIPWHLYLRRPPSNHALRRQVRITIVYRWLDCHSSPSSRQISPGIAPNRIVYETQFESYEPGCP